jgi:integrase
MGSCHAFAVRQEPEVTPAATPGLIASTATPQGAASESDNRDQLARFRSSHRCDLSAKDLLLMAGVRPKLVQDLLGHSTVALTLNTYSHVTSGLSLEVARTMDRIFGGHVLTAS